MAEQAIRSPLLVEDIGFDTPGSQTAPASQTVVTSTGGTANLTKVSANQVPVLDAPLVSGGVRHFSDIPVASDTDVEECLKVTRRNVRDFKNFEHCGGIPGLGSSLAQAQKNTEVFKKCMDDMAAESRAIGIFFPKPFVFAENGALGGLYASHMLPIDARPGLAFLGTGSETVLKRHASASTTFNLFFVRDSSNIVFGDLQIDMTGTTAPSAAIQFQSETAKQIRFFVDRIVTLGANRSLYFNGLSSSSVSRDIGRAWVTRCEFSDVTAIEGNGLSELWFDQNILLTGVVTLLATTGTLGLGAIFITRNRILQSGSGLALLIQRANTFDGAKHKEIAILDNRISLGDIQVTGLNEWEVTRNWLYDGSIQTNLAGITNAFGIRLEANRIKQVTSTFKDGMQLDSGGASVTKWWITANELETIRRHGIHLVASGALMRGGFVSRNTVRDVSQEAANTYDAIMLDRSGPGGGVDETLVDSNNLRSTNAALKMRYGVNEVAGGVTANNFAESNIIKGWGTADVFGTTEHNQHDLGTGV